MEGFGCITRTSIHKMGRGRAKRNIIETCKRIYSAGRIEISSNILPRLMHFVVNRVASRFQNIFSSCKSCRVQRHYDIKTTRRCRIKRILLYTLWFYLYIRLECRRQRRKWVQNSGRGVKNEIFRPAEMFIEIVYRVKFLNF